MTDRIMHPTTVVNVNVEMPPTPSKLALLASILGVDDMSECCLLDTYERYFDGTQTSVTIPSAESGYSLIKMNTGGGSGGFGTNFNMYLPLCASLPDNWTHVFHSATGSAKVAVIRVDAASSDTIADADDLPTTTFISMAAGQTIIVKKLPGSLDRFTAFYI